jgi:hypothetical protein
MARPRLFRRVRFNPNVTYFKPAGIRMIELKESVLGFDEFEAVRLKDLEGLEQEECAKKMNISQPTFNRLVRGARKKIADAIINGKAIKIEGGDFKMAVPRGRGLGLGLGRGRGLSGRGRMGGFAAGPGGICKCPKCGYEEPQVRAQPCMNKKCPKCGTLMTRG